MRKYTVTIVLKSGASQSFQTDDLGVEVKEGVLVGMSSPGVDPNCLYINVSQIDLITSEPNPE